MSFQDATNDFSILVEDSCIHAQELVDPCIGWLQWKSPGSLEEAKFYRFITLLGTIGFEPNVIPGNYYISDLPALLEKIKGNPNLLKTFTLFSSIFEERVPKRERGPLGVYNSPFVEAGFTELLYLQRNKFIDIDLYNGEIRISCDISSIKQASPHEKAACLQ